MLLDVLQTLPLSLSDAAHWTNTLPPLDLAEMHSLTQSWVHDGMVLAQQFKEPNLAGDVGKMWGHFVKTGQVWAFMIGMVAGYLVKAFTSFG
jgi:hypothetical protein